MFNFFDTKRVEKREGRGNKQKEEETSKGKPKVSYMDFNVEEM